MSSQRVLIYLLRRDLRLADNPIFHEIGRLASQSQTPFTHVLPVYVFPAQQVEVSGFIPGEAKSPYPEAKSEVGKFWRCGPHRAKFLAESVWELKSDLESKGSGLVMRAGMVGDVIKDLLSKYEEQKKDEISITAVWMTDEEGVEEKREVQVVRKAVESSGVEFKLWLDEKYFIDDRDVPFDKPSDLPDVFTSYRKSVEPLREAPRKVLAAPRSLPDLPSFVPEQARPFTMPNTYDQLESAFLKPLTQNPILKGMSDFPSDVETGHPFHGGALAGQKRIQHLIKTGAMTHYKDTRNGLLGLDYSTKLSAWLALGCITARQIHFQLLDFEDGKNDQYKGTEGYGKGENKGTSAVRFELLWRDYMRLCTRKFGPRLFRVEGFRDDSSHPWKTPGTKGAGPEVEEMVNRFLRGATGTGLIDASQRELFHTGYTSNRARQNVASYLAKHLGINWKLGAEWYESMLTDYDLSSNWGNWQYVAGVGNDPRGEARVFNPVKQAVDYDPHGEYVQAWVEETRGLEEPQEIFQIWKVDQERRKELGLDGNEMVEKPLKKIDYRVDRKPSKNGNGGRYGGSSKPKNNGSSESNRGKNGGGRGGHRGRGGKASTNGNGHGNGNGHTNGNANGNGNGNVNGQLHKNSRSGPTDKVNMTNGH